MPANAAATVTPLFPITPKLSLVPPASPSPGELKPWSIDVLADTGGMVLIDACLPQAVYESLLARLQCPGYYVVAENGCCTIHHTPIPATDTTPGGLPPSE